MQNIRNTVGHNAVNNHQDVLIVQTLLKQQGASYLQIDGICGPLTKKAIIDFQSQFYTHPDGVVTPGKKTLEHLNNFSGSLPHKSNVPPAQDHNNQPPPLQPWQKGGGKQRGSADEATKNAAYPQIVTIEMLDAVNPEGKNK